MSSAPLTNKPSRGQFASELLDSIDLRAWRRQIKLNLVHSAVLGTSLAKEKANNTVVTHAGDPRDLRIAYSLVTKSIQEYAFFSDQEIYQETSTQVAGSLEYWDGRYTGNAKEVYFYLVELEGEFDWFYQVPITDEHRQQGIEDWKTWTNEFGKRTLKCYKIGITKHKDIKRRHGRYLKRVLFQQKCRLNVAYNAEALFLKKLYLRFPKSSGPTAYGLVAHGRQQGISADFNGSTETFLFWKNEDYLTELASRVLALLEVSIDVDGINGLNRQGNLISLLMNSVLVCAWSVMARHPHFHDLYPWADRDRPRSSFEAPRLFVDSIGDVPTSTSVEELFEWAIDQVKAGNVSAEEVEYMTQVANKHGLLEVAQYPFLENIVNEANKATNLEQFGETRGYYQKLRTYRKWCFHEVDYSPLSREASNEELDTFNAIRKCLGQAYQLVMKKRNDSLYITLGTDQSKTLASFVSRGPTKLLVIFDSEEPYRVQTNSASDITQCQERLRMALYRVQGLHRYCEWLKEYCALRDKHKTKMDLFMRYSAMQVAEKNKLVMEHGPIGIPSLPEGREYECVNAEEMEVYLIVCEVCRTVTDQRISLSAQGRHGSSRDIYINREDGKRPVKTDVIVRLLSQGGMYGWHINLRVKVFDSPKPKIIRIGHPIDILASSDQIVSALLKTLSSC
jgi:hypothetical protein